MKTLGGYELSQVAHAIEAELKRVPGTREIYTVGASKRVVHVLLDSAKIAGFNISLDDLRNALAQVTQPKMRYLW